MEHRKQGNEVASLRGLLDVAEDDQATLDHLADTGKFSDRTPGSLEILHITETELSVAEHPQGN